MAQYIPVYMDNEKKNYHNKGLYDIIVFIGEHSKNGAKLSRKEAYKRGKRIINSRLHKWHSSAIAHLVVADKKEYAFSYDQITTKPIWRIHRSKAVKIFNAIYWILQGYKDIERIRIFNKICKKYGFLNGANAVGNPYYDVIKDRDLCQAQNYNKKDDNDLKKCADTINLFSSYH